MKSTFMLLASLSAVAFYGSNVSAAVVASDLSLVSNWTRVTPTDPDGPGGENDFPFINNTQEDGNAAEQDTVSVQWGEAQGLEPNNMQSKYLFTESAVPGAPSDASLLNNFVLGTFTHDNRIISDPKSWLVEADLTVTLSGTLYDDSEGTPELFDFALTTVLKFSHDETLNNGNCPAYSVSDCDDVVSVSVEGTPEEIEIMGTKYSLGLAGFFLGDTYVPGESKVFSSWLTQENKMNNALLVAGLTKTPPPVVPLPAGVWLLLSGFGLLGVARRAKKTA